MSGGKPFPSAGVDLLLITGRVVHIQQERSAFVLVSRRFILFLLGTFSLSFMLFAFLSGGSVQLQHKAIGWFVGCALAVTAIYFIFYVFMNYVSSRNPTMILSPVLSLFAVATVTPIVLAVMMRWVPPDELRATAASYFFGGILTTECAMVVFVHLVRDPLVRRFEEDLRRRNAEPSASVRIGPEVFPLGTLCYIEAENQYVKVYLQNRNVLISGQLTDVERQLHKDAVFRPHRSFLVFRHGIAAVQVDDSGMLSILTKCGRHLPVARRRVAPLREWLGSTEMPGTGKS